MPQQKNLGLCPICDKTLYIQIRFMLIVLLNWSYNHVYLGVFFKMVMTCVSWKKYNFQMPKDLSVKNRYPSKPP